MPVSSFALLVSRFCLTVYQGDGILEYGTLPKWPGGLRGQLMKRKSDGALGETSNAGQDFVRGFGPHGLGFSLCASIYSRMVASSDDPQLKRQRVRRSRLSRGDRS
jgi:hypothetical protein